jgi:hypothetical protein
MTMDQIEKHLSDLNKRDPDRAAFLTDRLFGWNGLMVAPKKKTTVAPTTKIARGFR